MAWKPPSSDQYSGFCASIILPSAWEESPSDSPPRSMSPRVRACFSESKPTSATGYLLEEFAP